MSFASIRGLQRLSDSCATGLASVLAYQQLSLAEPVAHASGFAGYSASLAFFRHTPTTAGE